MASAIEPQDHPRMADPAKAITSPAGFLVSGLCASMPRMSHFWHLIQKHHDELQALGPIATLAAAGVAALVTIAIGWLQYRVNKGQRDIAASQRDIAKMRVRMDLHDKRYEIIRATRDLMAAALTTEVDRARMEELRRVVQQTRFFFPPHIAEAANELDGFCVDASVLGRSTNTRPDILERAHQAQMMVAKNLDRWPAPYAEVMMFKDVE